MYQYATFLCKKVFGKIVLPGDSAQFKNIYLPPLRRPYICDFVAVRGRNCRDFDLIFSLSETLTNVQCAYKS